MRKLDRLKLWYTLPEAAERLTITLGESITENELIQSAAEGYLTISWFITDKHKFSAFEVTALGSTVLDEDGDRNEDEVFGLFNLPTQIYQPWIFGLLALLGKGVAPEHGRLPMIFNPENNKYFALESPYNYDTDKFMDFPSKEDLVVTQKNLETFEQGMKAIEEEGKTKRAPSLTIADVTPPSRPGITKGQVINAFKVVYQDHDWWTKALGKNIPAWLMRCRVTPGKRGNNSVSATWNPVLIAAALIDKRIKPEKLDVVFVHLKDWRDEWVEVSANDR